jgi:hypothetical protein
MIDRNRAPLVLGALVLVIIPIIAGWLAPYAGLGKDEVRHFAYLHSLVFDRDVDFANEFRATYPKFANEPWFVEETGIPPNPSPIGPALFWLPAYLLVLLLGLDPSGFGTASRGAAMVVSSGIFSLGVLATWDLIRSRTENAWASVFLVAGTSFFAYWWIFPGLFGHAIAVGLCGIYVWYWDRTLDRDDARNWAVLGLLGGLITIVRWQNALLPILSLAWKLQRARSARQAGIGTLAFGVAATVAFLPQLLVWNSIYDVWLTVPQGDIGEGLGFMHWSKPYLLDTLFSPRYGLLGFSPVLYVSVIGLVIGIGRLRDPVVALSCAYFAVALYVNASAGDWYAGATFGARRMDSAFPALVVGTWLALEGLSRIVERRPRWLLVPVLVASVVLTGILGGAYRSQRITLGMVGADEFPEQASAAVLDSLGWLPSLPAELYHVTFSGTRLGQYSALAGDDRLSWLDGVVVPQSRRLSDDWVLLPDGTARLDSDEGAIYLYLMDLGFKYRNIRLTLVFAGSADRQDPTRAGGDDPIEVRVNETRLKPTSGPAVGTQASRRWRYVLEVPYSVWRPGINRIDVRGRGAVLRQLRLTRNDS